MRYLTLTAIAVLASYCAVHIAARSVAHAFTQEQKDMGAAMIRAQGQPCKAITRLQRTRNGYRVSCGASRYHVVISSDGVPVALNPIR